MIMLSALRSCADLDTSVETIRRALDLGVTLIDTARRRFSRFAADANQAIAYPLTFFIRPRQA